MAARPRSFHGPRATSDFTVRRVTLEQQGGSTNGKPASAPAYTGKLIETVPARATPPR
ncbi:hypothetical protein [Nitrobacter sp. JJSN]|uniref:hypothetical protein n=1 Tax=Nitrobacter sp. JJSN TaxID=3453033 RepID=UPI003F767796